MLFVPISCSVRGGEESATATPVAPSATDMLERGAVRWDETASVHFALEVEGSTYLDAEETIELLSAEGDMEQPDRAFAVAKVTLGFVTIDVSLIFIGDDAYMTDILTGSWGSAPSDFSYNPGVLMSNEDGLSAVLRDFQNATLVGEESVNGTTAYHISGVVPLDLIDEITAGGLDADLIDVDIWFAVATYDVLKIVVAEPVSDGTTWVIELTNHNEPVSIERPDS